MLSEGDKPKCAIGSSSTSSPGVSARGPCYMEQQIKEVEKHIGHAFEILSLLEQKLDPVLQPMDTIPQKPHELKKEETPVELSLIERRLQNVVAQALQLPNRIGELEQRVRM